MTGQLLFSQLKNNVIYQKTSYGKQKTCPERRLRNDSAIHFHEQEERSLHKQENAAFVAAWNASILAAATEAEAMPLNQMCQCKKTVV